MAGEKERYRRKPDKSLETISEAVTNMVKMIISLFCRLISSKIQLGFSKSYQIVQQIT